MINAMFLKTVCSFALCAGGGYCGIVFASRYDTGINQLKSFIAALKAFFSAPLKGFTFKFPAFE